MSSYFLDDLFNIPHDFAVVCSSEKTPTYVFNKEKLAISLAMRVGAIALAIFTSCVLANTLALLTTSSTIPILTSVFRLILARDVFDIGCKMRDKAALTPSTNHNGFIAAVQTLESAAKQATRIITANVNETLTDKVPYEIKDTWVVKPLYQIAKRLSLIDQK